jgi:hypothetical protein
MQQRQMERLHKYLIHFLTQPQQEFMLLNGNLVIHTQNNLKDGIS